MGRDIKVWDTPICALGEGPVWDSSNGQLYWTDIHGKALYCMSLPKRKVQTWSLPQRLCSFALRQGKPGFIGAFETGFARLTLADKVELEWIEQPYALGSGIRFNDGKTDPAGRFLSGSMDEACAEPLGRLWALNSDETLRVIHPDVCVSNSLAWSPDGKIMYFADSMRKLIWRFDYDMDTGAIGPAVEYCDTSDIAGVPDGSAMDSEGILWTAFYGGGCIARIDPTGKVIERIDLPVAQPTCCAFGGDDLTTLFVTTAAENLPARILHQQPASGKIISFRTNSIGTSPPPANL